LIVVLVVLGLYGLARQHYVHSGRSHPTILPYLPAVAILLMYSRYDHPLAACLTLVTGLLLSLVFETAPARRLPIRIAVFCLAAGSATGWEGPEPHSSSHSDGRLPACSSRMAGGASDIR
jgi:hypothetical protein